MNLGGDILAAAHLGGDDHLALVFRLDREESLAGDVGVQEAEIGVPRLGGRHHGVALRSPGHEVHVGARNEVDPAAAGVDVDHMVGDGKEDGRQVVREGLAGRPVLDAGKAAVEVLAVEG